MIDDVWREQDLRPFLQGGPNTTRLITTRNNMVLPPSAIRQAVDAMREGEALALLARGLPAEQTEVLRPQLGRLAERLGEWALLLKLVNGFLRDRIEKRQPLAQALNGANQRLDGKGLVAFDARQEFERTKAVARTIEISLDLLDANGRARFGELAVFREDVDIPIAIIVRLWSRTGAIAEFESEDLLSELYNLSLLLDLDLNQRMIRLHDTVRHFLQAKTEAQRLVDLQRVLVDVLNEIRTMQDIDTLARSFVYSHLPYHIFESRQPNRLDRLLLDPSWLKQKLAITRSPQALISDFDQHGSNDAHDVVGRALRATTRICTNDPSQLLAQLLSRLEHSSELVGTDFLSNVRRHIDLPALRTQFAGLNLPRKTIRLEGHTARINALCYVPKRDGLGCVVSASSDGTIRVWEWNTGRETARFDDRSAGVTVLSEWDEHQMISGCRDGTIRLWDLATGRETACLTGHSGRIFALDHRSYDSQMLASGSADKTIRLWDMKVGRETARLEGHSDAVKALRIIELKSEKLLVSASHDQTLSLRVWDLATGGERNSLRERGGACRSLLQPGRIFCFRIR